MSSSSESLKMSTARSGMTLIIGQILSQSLLGLTSIALIRLLLPAEYGLYAIALIPFGLLQPLRDMGMHYSVQHHLSRPEAREKELAVRMMQSGVLWEVVLGIVLSLLLLISAESISQWLGVPSLVIILIVSTPTLASMGVVRVAYGSSIALNKPKEAAGLMIFTSGSKLLLSVSFVLLGEGAFGAMIGFAISTVISAFLCTAYLTRLTKVLSGSIENAEEHSDKIGHYGVLRRLLQYGSPIGIADFTALLSSQIILFIAAATITTAEFGVFNSAYVLYLYVYSIFAPLLLSLLSMFSGMERDSAMQQMAYQRTTNIAATLASFIGLAVVISAETIVALLFGLEYIDGVIVLALLGAVLLLFPLFGSLSSGMLLLGTGNPNYYSISHLIASVFGATTGFFLIPEFGILGIVLALYATFSSSTILLYGMVNKKLTLKLDLRRSLGGMATSIMSLLAGVYLFQTLQAWNIFASLLIALIVAEISGLAAFVRIGIFTRDDAEILERILAEIPGIRILGRVLYRFTRIVSR